MSVGQSVCLLVCWSVCLSVLQKLQKKLHKLQNLTNHYKTLKDIEIRSFCPPPLSFMKTAEASFYSDLSPTVFVNSFGETIREKRFVNILNYKHFFWPSQFLENLRFFLTWNGCSWINSFVKIFRPKDRRTNKQTELQCHFLSSYKDLTKHHSENNPMQCQRIVILDRGGAW